MHDFILSKDRYLELQNFFGADLMKGDREPVAGRAKPRLSG